MCMLAKRSAAGLRGAFAESSQVEVVVEQDEAFEQQREAQHKASCWCFLRLMLLPRASCGCRTGSSVLAFLTVWMCW